MPGLLWPCVSWFALLDVMRVPAEAFHWSGMTLMVPPSALWCLLVLLNSYCNISIRRIAWMSLISLNFFSTKFGENVYITKHLTTKLSYCWQEMQDVWESSVREKTAGWMQLRAVHSWTFIAIGTRLCCNVNLKANYFRTEKQGKGKCFVSHIKKKKFNFQY